MDRIDLEASTDSIDNLYELGDSLLKKHSPGKQQQLQKKKKSFDIDSVYEKGDKALAGKTVNDNDEDEDDHYTYDELARENGPANDQSDD